MGREREEGQEVMCGGGKPFGPRSDKEFTLSIGVVDVPLRNESSEGLTPMATRIRTVVNFR